MASILVNPPSPNLLVGGQLQLSSITLGESGDVLAGRSVFWQSSNPLVASIDNTGLLTGLAAGVTTITASSENRNASVGVTVLPVPVATIEISPALDTVVVGQTTQLTAVPRDAIGTPLPDRPVAWSSSNAAIASVSASGLVVGAQAGAVTITGTSEGKTSTSRIVVNARPVSSIIVSPAQIALVAGQSIKLTIQITDDNGTLLTGRPVAFASGNSTIAQVASDGTVTGVKEGSTSITVTSEGRTGTASVVVSASPIATVRINAPAQEMAIGATQKFTATLLDAANNVLPARPINWSSGAPGIASIAADGTVSALSAGTAIIFANVEGKLASVSLTVRAITVASVVVAPGSANMSVGDLLDLGAQPRDAGAAVIAGRTVLWTSSDEHIAVVSSTGRVRALAAGQVLITATVDGISGSSAITTTVEPVLTVTAEPASLNLLPLQTATIVATARGRNGIALSGRGFTYISTDPTVATVSSIGLVTAIKTGHTNVVISSEGKSVTVPVEVALAPVATVVVTLPNPSRFVGQTMQAGAVVRDAQGNLLTGRPVVWTSSNANVASVSATGVVSAVAPGTASITATSEGKSGSGTVTVSLVPVATVSVVLPAPARYVTQTTQAVATTKDSVGGVLTGRPVVWSTSDPNVATVSASGLVTAKGPGTANITASSEGKTGSAPVTVTLVPVAHVTVSLASPNRFVAEKTQATAVLTDSAGNVLTGRAVLWTSSNATVASVTVAGLVSALAPGSADITATSETIVGKAPITVTLAPVATIVVTLANPSRFVGQTTQASAVLRDASGNVLTGRTIVWSSADQTVATVTSLGLVSAVGPGTKNITATSEGISASAALTVSLVPVSTVVVSAPQTALQTGQTSQATAVTRDSIGVVLTGRPIAWSTSNASAATVSATGLITAGAPGNATITATSEGKTGTINIVVTFVPVNSVSVSIDKPTLFVGYTAQATSVTRDAAFNVLTGRVTTWSSSNTNVATVAANGVITAVAPGSSVITGTSEGKTGNANITVTIAPVEFVTIAVAATNLLVGQTTQADVFLSDANSRPLTGRPIVYSSSNDNVATVTQGGVVKGVSSGSANIIATSEGKSGFVTVNVSLVPVSSVTVHLATNGNTVFIGATVLAIAESRDAQGNLLPGRTALWTSSDPDQATVDGAGNVLGKLAGPVTISVSIEGKNAQIALTVVPAPVFSLNISLTSPTIQLLQSTQATVVLRDVNNNVLTGRPISYVSSNPLTALVSPTGVVTAVLPGSSTITATSENVSNTAIVTVTLVPVNSVSVTLDDNTLIVGTTTEARAVTKDAANNVLAGRTVAWSSTNPGVATVNAAGHVISIAPGATNITATSEGKSGFQALTVAEAPVATVTVSLTESNVIAGATSQASAVLKDVNNNVLTGRTIVWSSTNTSVATVDPNGRVTTVQPGTSNIRATSEGKVGLATIVVDAPPPTPVATVAVSLTATTVVAGATSQATAVLKDASNNVLNGRTVVWSSTNPSVATVNAAGLVTTFTNGSTNITATSEGKTDFETLTVTAVPVATVVVSLSATPVVAGATSQAAAVLRDGSNNILTGRNVAWTSTNQGVATVDADGLVTTLSAGTTNITATSETKTGFATLTVTAAVAPVATVTVSLTATTVLTGETSQASAVLKDASNNVLNGRPIAWSSSNPAVATVNASGLVTTLSSGTTNIIATSETKTGQATLTVNAPVATVTVSLSATPVVAGATAQATAVLKDANNNVLTGRTTAWTSSNQTVATVDADGLVTTLSAGTTNITATSETKTGFATLTVTAAVAPVATVTVSLTATTVLTGETSQASAVLKDASNNVLNGRPIAWSSSNPAVATVNASGLVTTLSSGTTNIIATSETKTGQATLTVNAPVATVTVSLSATPVVAGATAQATAVLKDANNNVLTGRTTAWTSSNQTVATVDIDGVVTTLTAGTTVIKATSETKFGTATLTVTAPPPPVATVTVTLNASTVFTGATSQASAVLKDAGNNVLNGRTIGWSSSNQAVATVNASGLVTTLTSGTTNIIATSETKTGQAILTVNAPVAAVTVSLSATPVTTGATSQATAVLKDASNNVLTGRTIAWSSSSPSVATVNSSGLVSTLTSGTTNIIATSETKTGQATLTVNAPVATVTVTLSPTPVPVGTTSQATAVLKDANNNVLTGRVIVWSSLNTNVATVNASGLVTTLSAGTANIRATSETKTGQRLLTVTNFQ
ncbi:MAG: Ig-like domain-containing protein [Gemmatimonas sp.]